MSQRIRVLSDHTINQIAAGEVIENPSSVVKELVENAIDAKSTSISVEIQAGGRQLIRITDNGCGMSPDDALLSLERHATSKICSVEEISHVTTMGFRGEAIPSIAAIAKVQLHTCPDSTGKSTLLTVNGGSIGQVKTSTREQGTTIEVKQLFYNVPVRRRFQRSPNYDFQAIKQLMIELALSHPKIGFSFIADGKKILHFQPNNESSLATITERVAELLQEPYKSSPFMIDHQTPQLQIRGVIAKPEHHLSNKSGQHLFINSRVVQSNIVARAVQSAFGTTIPERRYPQFVLYIDLKGEDLDVNVHPQKKHVRLRDSYQIEQTIQQVIAQKIVQQPKISPHFPSLEKESIEWSPDEEIPISLNPIQIKPVPYTVTQSFTPIITAKQEVMDTVVACKEKQTLDWIDSKPGFILCDGKGFSLFGLPEPEPLWIVIDQRRAHQRILFEQSSIDQALSIQHWMLPKTLPFSEKNCLKLLEQKKILEKIGILIEENKSDCITILGTRPLFSLSDTQKILDRFLQENLFLQNTPLEEEIIKKQIATSAISSSCQLSSNEARALLKDLLECKQMQFCPAGLPIAQPLTI